MRTLSLDLPTLTNLGIQVEEETTSSSAVEKDEVSAEFDTTTIDSTVMDGEDKQAKAGKIKTQRNYPIYYVNTKVNGKFGKSVRAFSSDEFVELYPTNKN